MEILPSGVGDFSILYSPQCSFRFYISHYGMHNVSCLFWVQVWTFPFLFNLSPEDLKWKIWNVWHNPFWFTMVTENLDVFKIIEISFFYLLVINVMCTIKMCMYKYILFNIWNFSFRLKFRLQYKSIRMA